MKFKPFPAVAPGRRPSVDRWRRWFAWWPVEVPAGLGFRRYVWLEHVARRHYFVRQGDHLFTRFEYE